MRSEKNGGALLSACWDIFISGNRASIGRGTFPLDDSADKRRGEARGVWRVLTFGQHKTRRLLFDWTKCQWSDFLHLQTCNCQQKVSKRSLVFVTWLGLLFPSKEMLCTPEKAVGHFCGGPLSVKSLTHGRHCKYWLGAHVVFTGRGPSFSLPFLIFFFCVVKNVAVQTKNVEISFKWIFSDWLDGGVQDGGSTAESVNVSQTIEWKCLANECGTFPHKDLNSNEMIVQKWTLFFGPSARDEADDENGRPQWERDELISRGRRGDVAAKQQIKVSTAGNEAATCKRNGPQHPRFVIVASLMNQLVDWTVDMLMRGCETLDPVDIWHPADHCAAGNFINIPVRDYNQKGNKVGIKGKKLEYSCIKWNNKFQEAVDRRRKNAADGNVPLGREEWKHNLQFHHFVLKSREKWDPLFWIYSLD